MEATDFIFWGPKIMVDSDCSHKIKRHLLLGRKAMTNLDSKDQLKYKNRDVILLTKVAEAMVFPVIMYRCESWTISKAERQRTLSNCGAGEDS